MVKQRKKGLTKHNIDLGLEANDKLEAILEYMQNRENKGIKPFISPYYTKIFTESINMLYESIQNGEWEQRHLVEKL